MKAATMANRKMDSLLAQMISGVIALNSIFMLWFSLVCVVGQGLVFF